MARARKSHKTREEDARPTRNGLEAPRGQPGQNRYVIYVDYHRPDLQYPKILVLSFKAKYAAKFFLDCLIEGDSYVWDKPIGSRSCIRTDFGLRISMFGEEEFKMLLDYQPTALEAEWHDEQVNTHARRLKYGTSSEDRKAFSSSGSSEEQDEGPEHRGDDRDEKRPKRKVPKEKKEPKPKVDKTGLISANDIAKELGVEGREVRGVLRAMKLQKPEGGWLFNKKTADDIREKVKKGLKEAKKKKAKK